MAFSLLWLTLSLGDSIGKGKLAIALSLVVHPLLGDLHLCHVTLADLVMGVDHLSCAETLGVGKAQEHTQSGCRVRKQQAKLSGIHIGQQQPRENKGLPGAQCIIGKIN